MSHLRMEVNRRMMWRTRGNLGLLGLKGLVFGLGYDRMKWELRTVHDYV